MNQLLERLNILIGNLKLFIGANNLSTPQGQKIFETAKSLLGTDASPYDLARDELGCAETVSEILIKAGFKMPILVSTAKLNGWLSTHKEWLEVNTPIAGDVVISPTGQGGLNGVLNGHTGIVGTLGVIMSNSSATGRFEPNYSISSWNSRYAVKGGYPVKYYRRVL